MTSFDSPDLHQTVPNIYQYAERMVRAGYGADQIVHRLMVQGMAEEVAQELAANIRHTLDEAERRRAAAALKTGLLLVGIGLVMMAAGYQRGLAFSYIISVISLVSGGYRLLFALAYYLKQHRSL